MKLVEGMSYRQWQKRNTELFSSLTKEQQRIARQQGYCNVGWDKVQGSWRIISKLTKKIVTLFEHKLGKGDVTGAIALLISEAQQVKQLAQQAISGFDKAQQSFDQLVERGLANYSLL